MSQTQIKKRERGANYTPEEKILFSDLVKKYKYIIEDKRTGGQILLKKKDAWKAVTLSYNSNCTTGKRKTEHLKVLYDNLKQKLRKDAGENNKTVYFNSQQLTEENVTKDELSRVLNNLQEDKVMEKISQQEIEPLSNPYDSSAVYFKDKDKLISETDTLMHSSTSNSDSDEMEITVSDQDIQKSEKITNIPVKKFTPGLRKSIKHKKASTKIIKLQSAEMYKKIYFKKKCQNANLEKKKIMQDILQAKQIHYLQMALLKKELNDK